MNSNNYVSVLNLAFAFLFLGLNLSCGKLQSSMATDGQVIINANSQIVEWSYGTGTVAPSSRYAVVYRLNLTTKLFELIVTKGSSVIEVLPSGKTKTISDSELSQMKTMLGQLRYRACAVGSMLIGGGSELITLSSASTQTPTHQIYATDCVGNTTTTAFQSLSGFENVKTLFQTF